MPELPEVETIVRGLRPHLEGAKFNALNTSDKRLRFEYPPNLAQIIIGSTVQTIYRRAKYLVFGLDNENSLIIHLGMSGRLTLEKAGQNLAFDAYEYANSGGDKHNHAVFDLTNSQGENSRLIYNDPRRFGLIDVQKNSELAFCRHFKHLGSEPLEDNFDGALIIAALKNQKQPIKIALLNQENLVGLGNIYVCEALFLSHISPLRFANSLKIDEANRLAKNIQKVLSAAIDKGGSTLKDFRHSDGSMGGFQNEFLAYDREGIACTSPNCKGKIERITQAGRSTFFCANCQI